MFQQLIANGIIAGSTYALVALGFALIFSTTRFFHFAHGAVYTFGAYLTFLFFSLLNVPFIISSIIAVFLAGLIGVAIEYFVYKPIKLRLGSSSCVVAGCAAKQSRTACNMIPQRDELTCTNLRSTRPASCHSARCTTLIASTVSGHLPWLGGGYRLIARQSSTLTSAAEPPQIARGPSAGAARPRLSTPAPILGE